MQRSWGKVIFSEACVKNSVRGRGRLGLGPGGRFAGLAGGCLDPDPGDRLGGLTWGCLGPEPGKRLGSLDRGCPGPHLGVYPSMHCDRPPSRRLLLWAIRILLECILVS